MIAYSWIILDFLELLQFDFRDLLIVKVILSSQVVFGSQLLLDGTFYGTFDAVRGDGFFALAGSGQTKLLRALSQPQVFQGHLEVMGAKKPLLSQHPS